MIDDRFFIYWEETEWCLRLSRAGWLIFHVPQAKIWHKGVQRGYKPQPSFTYYCTRNRLLMLAKHHAPFNTRVFTWIEIIRTLASWSIKPKWRSLHSHRSAMWRGILDFMFRRFGKMPTDPI
jgi:GT2 family glycosyltransferase